MKRCWIGGALLLILLILGLLATWGLARCHTEVAREAELAAQAAMEEDWDRASILADQARQRWERCWGISAALSDHGVMENINGLFAQLEVYGRAGDRVAFAAVCAQLGQQARTIADAQSLQWWNIL